MQSPPFLPPERPEHPLRAFALPAADFLTSARYAVGRFHDAQTGSGVPRCFGPSWWSQFLKQPRCRAATDLRESIGGSTMSEKSGRSWWSIAPPATGRARPRGAATRPQGGGPQGGRQRTGDRSRQVRGKPGRAACGGAGGGPAHAAQGPAAVCRPDRCPAGLDRPGSFVARIRWRWRRSQLVVLAAASPVPPSRCLTATIVPGSATPSTRSSGQSNGRRG